MPGRRFRFVIFTLVIWALIAAGTEIGLRLAGFTPPEGKKVPEKYAKFRPDPELTWGLKKNWSGFDLNGAAIRTNSLGLRGPEPTKNPEKRVLFLGDSVTYGVDLEEALTIPAQLAHMLGTGFEVINAGVPGYSTFQSESFFKISGARLEPDLVILGFCLNDVTERYRHLALYGGDRFFMGDVDTNLGLSWPRRTWQATAIRNAIVSLMKSSARRGEEYRVDQLWEIPDAPHIESAWAQVEGEIDRLNEAVQASGARFVVVIYPYAQQVVDHSGSDAPQLRLKEYLQQHSVPCLDLLPQLRAETIAVQALFLDANHFTEQGAALVARDIKEFLQPFQQVFVKSFPPPADTGTHLEKMGSIQGHGEFFYGRDESLPYGLS